MRWHVQLPSGCQGTQPASARDPPLCTRNWKDNRLSFLRGRASHSRDQRCSRLSCSTPKAVFNRVTFLAVLFFFLSSSTCDSQIITYKSHAAPGPVSIVPEKGAFFLYGRNTKFYFPFLFFAPSHGSTSTPSAPTIRFKSVSLTKAASDVVSDTIGSDPESSSPSTVSPASLELSLLPYGYVRTMFSSASAAPFCCSPRLSPVDRDPSFSVRSEFLPTNECPYPGALKRYITGDPIPLPSAPAAGPGHRPGLPSDVSGVVLDSSSDREYVYPVKLKGAPGSEGQLELEVEDSGIYFLVISNCGEFKGLAFDGEVFVRNVYGYLPGYEYPKMPFYFVFMLVYLIVCVVWSCLMYRQRANLIAFHKFMLVVGILGFLESLALFVYLYDYNLRGERNKVLLVTSILVTVVKSIFSYMLVLLGAIGWSITIPVLQKKTVIKMQIVVVLYIILDTVRQVSDEFSNSHSLPLVLLLTCLIPISTLNGVLFYWIISSINNNIEMLQQQKQHEKLLIYKRLYAVLLLAIVLAIIDLLCQIYVASWDASDRWRDQWWLSDAIPHFLFLLVLTAMMAIWRPNQQSRRLAYFTELGDADELEGDPTRAKNATDMHVWGEELDFHDHFSEEELEAGIPNFKLQNIGSMSDEANLSDEGETSGLHGGGSQPPGRGQPGQQRSIASTKNKPQPQVVGRGMPEDEEVEMTTHDEASTNGRRGEQSQEGL